MAFFKKKQEEDFGMAMPQIPNLPPMPSDTRDLTGFGRPTQSATDDLARAEAFGMRPASSPYSETLPQGMPPAPVFRPAPAPARLTTEEIQEIAEAIIAEKWQKVGKEIDEIKKTQDDTSASLGGMQERMSNLEKKMDMVIQEILGKVDEYGKGIADVGTELKAMQKVFGTVMPTFTENIKDLQEVVGKAKEQGIKPKRKR
ncbi:MAG: hypothetical protein NTY99_02610 [DPANN group archaeon]|nr:hypothetical protein [DPANN group archaeon]